MKKNFLYLFTVLCTLSFFTACSDDDNAGDPNGLGVNKTFSSESLDLTYAGKPLAGKEISFETRDGETATITMKGVFESSLIEELMDTKSSFIPPMAPGVIPGEVTTTLKGVYINLDGDKYTFKGNDLSSDGREIKYSGEVSSNKLTISIDVVMPENALTGTWALANPSLNLKWNSTAKIKVDGSWFGRPAGEIEMPMEQATPLLNGMLSTMLAGVLQSVTFQEDGNVVANYRKISTTQWQESPVNMANYYIKNNKMYLQLNLSQIVAAMKSTKADNDFSALLQMLLKIYPYLSEGLPMAYTAADGKATVTMEKELILNLTEVLKMPVVQNAIIAKAPAHLKPIVEAILPQLPTILKETTDISATLAMEKK